MKVGVGWEGGGGVGWEGGWRGPLGVHYNLCIRDLSLIYHLTAGGSLHKNDM